MMPDSKKRYKKVYLDSSPWAVPPLNDFDTTIGYDDFGTPIFEDRFGTYKFVEEDEDEHSGTGE